MRFNSFEMPSSSLPGEEKKTFATKLAEMFPEKAEHIESETNRRLEELTDEMHRFNESEVSHPLTEEQLKVVLDFYNLKREKYLRDFFRINSLLSIEKLLQKIETYHTEKVQKRKGKINDLTYGGLSVKFSGDSFEVVDDDNDGLLNLDISKLRALRTAILLIIDKMKPDELSGGRRKIVEAQEEKDEDEENVSDLESEEIFGIISSKTKLVDFIKKSPTLVQDLQALMEKGVEYKHRYSMAKIKESSSMISELLQSKSIEELNKEGNILDLCCGEGDLSVMLRRMGANIEGVDVSNQYLKSAEIFSKVTVDEPSDFIKKRDVINEELPTAKTWISKHPCAPGLALPDEIIKRFSKDEVANKLILLTCCANKSIGCCPHEYLEDGVIDEETWDFNCRESSKTQTVDVSQNAMKTLNEARVAHIKKTTSFNARIVEINGSVMNQMIVVEK